MESLAPEVAPFGIRTMLVEPGFFRTELLTPESTKYAESSIDAYAERTGRPSPPSRAFNGQQGGDPAKARRRAGQPHRPHRTQGGQTDWASNGPQEGRQGGSADLEGTSTTLSSDAGRLPADVFPT
jgi:NAD(P)-dependent dehydrogenase (short-subunit alcohol dehydrogenase family)